MTSRSPYSRRFPAIRRPFSSSNERFDDEFRDLGALDLAKRALHYVHLSYMWLLPHPAKDFPRVSHIPSKLDSIPDWDCDWDRKLGILPDSELVSGPCSLSFRLELATTAFRRIVANFAFPFRGLSATGAICSDSTPSHFSKEVVSRPN